MPSFLSRAGLGALRREARALRGYAHHSEVYHTPWYAEPDRRLPADDPRVAALEFAVGYVGRDRIPPSGAIETLFGWGAVLELVQTALGSDSIYRFDDSLASLNITVMGRGETLGWHFDACEAVVSVLLESGEEGGHFEYVPPFGGAEEVVRAAVARVLRSEGDEAIEVPMEAGDFVLFRGRHSLHRVTPVEGARERLMLLMSYDNVAERPGDTRSNVDLFGRERARFSPS